VRRRWVAGNAAVTIERRAISGTVIGGVSFLFNAAQSLLLVPLLLGSWGIERYGAWLALQSLLALVTTLDAGHQQYIGGEIAKLYFGNRGALRVALASALWTAMASGAMELFIVAALWFAQLLPLATGLTPALVDREGIPRALLLLTFSSVLLNSVCGMMARLLPPAGKFVRFTVWGIVFRSLQALSVAGAALLGFGILGATVACTAAAVVVILVVFRDLRAQFPDLWPMHRGAHASVGARHYVESLLLTGSSTLTALQQSGLNLLVTGTLGAASLPALSTARTLSSTFFLVPSILSNPLSPDMTRFHITREYQKLHATFAANWLVGGSVIHLGVVVALPVLAPLYQLWTRHALPFDRALFAFLALAIALRTFGSPLQTYLLAINKLRAIATINVTQSLAVLATAAVFLPRLGVSGAGVAVLAGDLVGSCLVSMVCVAAEMPIALRALLWRDAGLALAPVAVTGVALFSYARRAPLLTVSFAAVAALLPLFWLQWRRMPTEVRLRIEALFASAMGRLRKTV